jgi:5-oxoprolinase (ATP-hydrolysing) subunit A
VLVGLSGSHSIHAAETAGLRVAHEVFAERGYGNDRHLLPRSAPGAVLASLDEALAQARELTLYGRVRIADGSLLSLRADTLCVHGDRADAAVFARALREALEADGVDILPFGVAA